MIQLTKGIMYKNIHVQLTFKAADYTGDKSGNMFKSAANGLFLSSYTNSFKDRTTIILLHTSKSKVRLEIFNVPGQRVRLLRELHAKTHVINQ